MEFQGYIEKLKAAFICEKYNAEIKKAKQEFIADGGELGGEADGYEEALNIFFDWYLFERPQSKEGEPPFLLLAGKSDMSDADKKVYVDFQEQIHSIFVVKKSGRDCAVTDMLAPSPKFWVFAKNRYVAANTSSAQLEKGDVVEARLLPFRGEYRFSGAFCFYPKSIHSIIKTEAAQARKAGAENFPPLIRKFRRLKTVWSRCSRMDVKKIYTLMEEGRIA